MKLLLDTHIFLWWLQDDQSLGEKARKAIRNPRNTVHISAASIWETTIKETLKRIDLGGSNLVEEIHANNFTELDITVRHTVLAGRLPLHHKDPFDRMLIAQSQAERLTIVTVDPAFQAYSVRLLGQ